jgi:hypothetical protein
MPKSPKSLGDWEAIEENPKFFRVNFSPSCYVLPFNCQKFNSKITTWRNHNLNVQAIWIKLSCFNKFLNWNLKTEKPIKNN